MIFFQNLELSKASKINLVKPVVHPSLSPATLNERRRHHLSAPTPSIPSGFLALSFHSSDIH